VYARLRDLPTSTWAWFAFFFVMYYIVFRWYPHVGLFDRVIGSDLSFYLGTWALEPNSMVTGRLAQNAVGGVFSEGMSMGLQGAYTRQYGLAGWLLTLPASATVGFSAAGVGLMVSLVSGLSALLASGAVLVMRRSLGRGSAILLGLALLLPWSVAIARSMYWTIGIKLLPAVILIWIMRSQRSSVRRLMLGSFAFTTIAALSGYEYFTVVAATQAAVLAYYSLRERWDARRTATWLGGLVISVLGGFVAALGIHLIQLYLRSGDMTRIEELARSALSRTGVGSGSSAQAVIEEVVSTPAGVLDYYLGVPVLGVEQSLPLIQQFTVGALILATAVVVLVGLARRLSTPAVLREQSLGVAWIVSLLGPLGWYLLARPHSVMHTFMNVSLWFLPTIPLALALLWPPLRRSFAGTHERPLPWVWLGLVMLGLLISFAYSQLTAR
jgi:hypothetical protein